MGQRHHKRNADSWRRPARGYCCASLHTAAIDRRDHAHQQSRTELEGGAAIEWCYSDAARAGNQRAHTAGRIARRLKLRAQEKQLPRNRPTSSSTVGACRCACSPAVATGEQEEDVGVCQAGHPGGRALPADARDPTALTREAQIAKPSPARRSTRVEGPVSSAVGEAALRVTAPSAAVAAAETRAPQPPRRGSHRWFARADAGGRGL